MQKNKTKKTVAVQCSAVFLSPKLLWKYSFDKKKKMLLQNSFYS